MNCLIYVRVSTDKQVAKELSIPAQVDACRRFAADRGWLVSEEFVEPGFSARSTDRPALHQLLASCRSHRGTGVVLVHKIDRLARNVADHAMIRAVLKKHGVQLASVSENLDDSSSGRLVENMVAAISEFYSANLSDEVKKGMRQKVLGGGWPHQAPRGYRLKRHGAISLGRLEIDPEHGPQIKRAFELYATGQHALKPLTELLALEGLTTVVGKPLSPSYLRDVLANEFYVGRIRWNDLSVQGQHPALVSEELFAEVQVVLNNRQRVLIRRPIKPGFVLSRVGRCATCLGPVSVDRHNGFGYYRCGRRTYRKESCTARRYTPAPSAHSAIEMVCDLIPLNSSSRGIVLAELRKEDDWQAQLERHRLEQLEKRGHSLMLAESRLTDAFLAGEVSRDVYADKNRALREERAAVAVALTRIQETALKDERGKDLKLNSCTSVGDAYRATSDEQRALLLETVFDAVLLDHTGIIGYTLKAAFLPRDLQQQTATRAA